MKKIVWLASYPKSGNTWFRAFLTALERNMPLNLNSLKSSGTFSSRGIFEFISDLDSTLLYPEEVKNMLPDIFEKFAIASSEKRLYIKIHDGYIFNQGGIPIVPSESTLCALYFVRNPLDIVSSLAHHNGTNVDKAIRMMNDNMAAMSVQKRNQNISNQLRQELLSWSGHVESWTTLPNFPVKVIRYEDMLEDTFKCFKDILIFLKLDYNDEEIANAIVQSSFKNLKELEEQTGFREKNPNCINFFRQGVANGWRKELTKSQVKKITSHHHQMMERYNYLL